MKSILFAFFLVLLTPLISNAQPMTQFSELDHDFGNVLNQDQDKVEHVFEFSNEGDEDLLIQRVESSGSIKAVARPSRLKPGEKGHIEVVVDVRGKKGFYSKTIEVYTNDPMNPVTKLSVKISVRDRIHMNQFKATEIFSGSCRECHVEQGRGKKGWELFKADCFMCHNAGRNTSLSTMSKKPPAEMLKAIREGVENTLMPGFDLANGGPLNDADIESLMELITR